MNLSKQKQFLIQSYITKNELYSYITKLLLSFDGYILNKIKIYSSDIYDIIYILNTQSSDNYNLFVNLISNILPNNISFTIYNDASNYNIISFYNKLLQE